VSVCKLELRRVHVQKKSLIVLIVLAGIFFLLSNPKVYVIRGSAGGTLYWNADEVLLFTLGASSGAHMGYPRYALEPFLVAIGHARAPDDERCSQAVVIQITDKDVRRYDTDLYKYAEAPYCGMHFAVFDGRIYAGYLAKGRIWRWSGTRFEPATQEELRGFDPMKSAERAGSHPWEFDNVDGWSMRALGQTPPEYQFVVNGQPLTIIFHGETWPPGPVSVDLIRPGQPPQTIWSFDGRPHPVSLAEYGKIFRNH
jgi:hypothetical protein